MTNGPILVESVLALGGEAHRRAAAFMVWRYQTESPGDAGGVDPEAALLLLLVLATASDPTDARLEGLATRLVEGAIEPLVGEIAGSMREHVWRDLVARVLGPHAASRPSFELLVEALAR